LYVAAPLGRIKIFPGYKHTGSTDVTPGDPVFELRNLNSPTVSFRRVIEVPLGRSPIIPQEEVPPRPYPSTWSPFVLRSGIFVEPLMVMFQDRLVSYTRCHSFVEWRLMSRSPFFFFISHPLPFFLETHCRFTLKLLYFIIDY